MSSQCQEGNRQTWGTYWCYTMWPLPGDLTKSIEYQTSTCPDLWKGAHRRPQGPSSQSPPMEGAPVGWVGCCFCGEKKEWEEKLGIVSPKTFTPCNPLSSKDFTRDPAPKRHKMGIQIKHLLIITHKEFYLELLQSCPTGQKRSDCGCPAPISIWTVQPNT